MRGWCRRPLALGLGCLLVLTLRSSAEAQYRFASDHTVVSRSEWRGITRSSGWAYEQNTWASIGTRLRLAVGLWGAHQFAATDPISGIGLDDGQLDPWMEVSATRGLLEVAGGWVATFFPGDRQAAVTPERELLQTHELFVRARLNSASRWVPSIIYYHDVDEIGGGYLEPSLTYRLPLWPQAVLPLGSLFLTARAGISLGQASDLTDPTAVGHFGEDGLTHWDLSASLPMSPVLTLGPLELAPVFEFHVQVNRDPVTRVKTIGAGEAGTTIWWRFGLATSGPRCRPEKRICNP